MSKTIKYILIACVSLGILFTAAVLVITTFVDVESYKPEIEQLVTEKTGYPLHLNGKIGLSLFPWVGLSFTDLQLDNPQGFEGKTFVRIDGFQARLKVMPLLSKKVEVGRFVVSGPEILLEKSAKGVWNWQNLTTKKEGKAKAPAPSAGEGKPQKEEGGSTLALDSLVVEEFSIDDGRILFNDLQAGQKHEVSNLSLQLNDVSLDKPVSLAINGLVDGKPLKVEGTIGPVGPDPGKGEVKMELILEALERIKLQAGGTLTDLTGQLGYALDLAIEPFSPRGVFSALGMKFPVATADQKVLDKVGLVASVKGDTRQFALSGGKIVLDDSTMDFEIRAKDFSRPDLSVKAALDAIDLDRYLPQTKEGSPSPQDQESAAPQPGKGADINYDPLRKLVLKAVLTLGELRAHGGKVNNLALDVTAKNGLISLRSLGMDLYDGKIAATGKVNVAQKTPVSEFDLNVENVQAGPLIKDFTGKEIIEGLLEAEIGVSFRGDKAETIKKGLMGKGSLRFEDGALIGLDLAQMARNIKSGFTLEQQGGKPKTDFAELLAPFTITNGLVNTPETILRSPFIRVVAAGDANLVSEALDLKVKPTVVGTMKGQGDAQQRSGVTIPVLVGGTFQKPKFSPDLGALVKDRLPGEKDLGQLLKTGKTGTAGKEQLKKEVDQAKGLLKGLLGN